MSRFLAALLAGVVALVLAAGPLGFSAFSTVAWPVAVAVCTYLLLPPPR